MRIFKKIKFNLQFTGKSVLSFLFPPLCSFCGETVLNADDYFCPSCLKKIEIITDNYCRNCHLPLKENEKNLCRDCIKKSFLFDKLVSLGEHKTFLKELIYILKYKKNKKAGRILGKKLALKLADYQIYSNVDIVIPVPLHKNRIKKRGYNQSSIIGKSLVKHWPFSKKPLLGEVLIRVKDTRTQLNLNKKERKSNVGNAFICIDAELIKGKTVLILDDVMTSGATVNECVKTVRKYEPFAVLAASVTRVRV